MTLRKLAAGYAILVGFLMITMWTALLLGGQVPELQTEPWSIALHLVAEFATALALITSGYGLLRARAWAQRSILLALGMLLYTLIQSPGYYAQLGQFSFVAMFVILALPALYLGATFIRRAEPI